MMYIQTNGDEETTPDSTIVLLQFSSGVSFSESDNTTSSTSSAKMAVTCFSLFALFIAVLF